MEEEYNQEQIERLIESLGPLPDSFNRLADSIKNANSGLGPLGNSAKDASDQLGTLSTASKGASDSQTKQSHTTEDNIKRSKAAYDQSIAALNTLGDALTNSQPSFADLGGVATNAGKSLGNLAENLLPAFGAQINVAIQLLGELSAAYLTQFSEQNEFGGQMRKMGVTVAEMGDGTRNTTDSMTDLAREAGYTSEMLSNIAGMMVKSSEAVALLGTNSTDGAKAFLEYSNISLAEQRRFTRLGYTIEDLNEVQTSYIELQRQSGINLKAQNLTAGQLQKRSLDYAKSLTAISEITGRNAEQQIAAEQQQKAEYRNKIVSMNQQREISALEREAANETDAARKKELQDKAQTMKDELDARTQMTGTLARILGPDLAEQINTVMITGNFDETTTAIAQLGLNAGDLATAFEGVDPDKPEEVLAATQKILSDVITGQEDGLARFGDALIRMGDDAEGFGKSVGLSAENLALYQQAMDSGDEDKAREILQEALDNVKETTKSGKDTQLDFQATLESMARAVRTATDGLLDFAGPAVLILTTGAIVALGVAATKAAMSLSLVGGGGGGKGIAKKATDLVKRGFKGPVSNALKIGGGVVAGGLMAASAYSEGADERLETADLLKEDKIDQSEADRRDTATNYETGAEMGGAMAGALSGAAMGAAFGPVGALIGAGLGAWMGAKGGSEIGEVIGASVGAKLEKDVKKANLALAEQSGFYDKKGAFRDSTVDFDKIIKAKDDETLTQDVLQSMLDDNDMSDEDEQRVYEILKEMKDNEQGLGTEETVADAEKAVAEKEVADEEKLIADLGLDGDTQAEIDDAVVEVQKEMVTKTDLLKDSIDAQKESNERLIAASTALAEVTQPPKPMNEATKEFIEWFDSKEGQAEIAAERLARAERMEEAKTSAENQMLAKEDQYREIVESGKFKGKDATESQLGQAKKYLEGIEETKINRLAMAEEGMLAGVPSVDISPEDAYASAEIGQSAEELQLGKSSDSESIAEKQLIATEKQNMLLGQVLSKQTEQVDLSEKIVQYSSV
jgi:hypothetical protein